MFICIDPEHGCGIGNTLKTAHESYEEYYGKNYPLEQFKFYEANKIEVEIQLVQKEIPIAKKSK